MSGKRENKKRRVFNTYNLILLLSVVVILGAGYILLERQGIDVASYLPINEVKGFFESKEVPTDGNETIDNDTSNVSDIPVVASATNDNSTQARNVKSNTNTPEPTTGNQTKESNANTNIASGKISEEKAKTIAKSEFESLGEEDVNLDELEVLEIKRKEELYYYISSKNNNTVEIKISDGTIARVNGVVVE